MSRILGPLVSLSALQLCATATLAQPPRANLHPDWPWVQHVPTLISMRAQPPKANLYPDWPCVQHKVPTLTSAQVWDGPPIDDLKGWQEDEAIRKLVAVLASRRVPMEEAVKALDAYAASVPESERDEKMKLVFAGLLETVNRTRSSVMSGIERFQQRQRARAEELERQGLAIIKLRERAETDETAKAELAKAEELYQWDSRIFQERQQNVPLACEIPVLIDQRVFDLGREIRKHMTT
jgi:hypothetical protein